MYEPKYEQEASNFCLAIRMFAENPERLENFENYLSYHFGTWLKRFGSTPEGLSTEVLHFAVED